MTEQNMLKYRLTFGIYITPPELHLSTKQWSHSCPIVRWWDHATLVQPLDEHTYVESVRSDIEE